jgi:large subunit ribosomal protein L25
MATTQLSATPRHEVGKGVARKLRSAGQVPAVIYGHGRESQSLTIDARELGRLLEKFAAASTVIELAVDGTSSKTLIREIQRHPFKRHILHVDFQQLVAGELVTVQIPLSFIGTPIGVKEGGILDQTMHELTIECDPSNIPARIEVDVTNLAIGHPLHVSDLTLPEGVRAMEDEDATVCLVAAPRTVVEEVVAPEAGAEAAAEPEVIRARKTDEDEEG